MKLNSSDLFIQLYSVFTTQNYTQRNGRVLFSEVRSKFLIDIVGKYKMQIWSIFFLQQNLFWVQIL